jgi:hypothetical protein
MWSEREKMDLKTNPSFADLHEVRNSAAEQPIEIVTSDPRGPPGSGPPYFDWRSRFPELQILLDNFEDILEESKTIQKVFLTFFSSFPSSINSLCLVDPLA